VATTLRPAHPAVGPPVEGGIEGSSEATEAPLLCALQGPLSGGQALHVPKHMIDQHTALDQLLRAHRRSACERQRCCAVQLLVAQSANIGRRRTRALAQL